MMNMLMTSQLCVFPTLCFSWSRHIRRINMKSLCWLRTSPELKQITTKEWSSLQTDGKVFVRLSCSYLNVDKISVVLLTFPQGKRFYKLKSCHRAYRSAISVVYHLNPIWVCGVPQGSILVYFLVCFLIAWGKLLLTVADRQAHSVALWAFFYPTRTGCWL